MMNPIKFIYDNKIDLSIEMSTPVGETADTMLDVWRRFMLAIGYSEDSIDGAILACSYDLVPKEGEV